MNAHQIKWHVFQPRVLVNDLSNRRLGRSDPVLSSRSHLRMAPRLCQWSDGRRGSHVAVSPSDSGVGITVSLFEKLWETSLFDNSCVEAIPGFTPEQTVDVNVCVRHTVIHCVATSNVGRVGHHGPNCRSITRRLHLVLMYATTKLVYNLNTLKL